MTTPQQHTVKPARRFLRVVGYSLLTLFVASFFVQFLRPSGETVAARHLESLGFKPASLRVDGSDYSFGMQAGRVGSESYLSLERITFRFARDQDSPNQLTVVVSRPVWFCGWRVIKAPARAQIDESSTP